ncbi:MAG: anti-sigma factor family protein [Anaerolineae bacterium]|jgi:hypothetical protein
MTDTRRSLEPDNEHVSHLLSPYLDGQVEEDERLQVERHLRTCSACRTELAQLRLIVGTMHAMPAMEPPRSFVLTPEMVQRRSWLSLWSTYSPAVAALAAVLLLALLFADVRLLQEPELALAPAVPEMVSQEAAAPAPEWDEANEPLAQPAAAAPLAPEATVAPAAVAPAQPAEAPEAPREPAPVEETEVAMLSAAGAAANDAAQASQSVEGPDAPVSATAVPADRRGLGSAPFPGGAEAGAQPSSEGESVESLEHEASGVAQSYALEAAPEDTPEGAPLAKQAEPQAEPALMDSPAPEEAARVSVAAEPGPLEWVLRAAEVAAVLVLAVALGTWGARLISQRRAAGR